MDTNVVHQSSIADRIRQSGAANPAGSDLLALMMFYSTQPLSIEMLHVGKKALPRRLGSEIRSREQVEAMIADLVGLGLVELHGGGLVVSEPVRAGVRAMMSPTNREEWLCVALGFMAELFTRLERNSAEADNLDTLLDHVFTVVNEAESESLHWSESGSLLSQVGLHLHRMGRVEMARRCYNRSIVFGKKTDDLSKDVLASRWNNLGVVQRELGDLEKAGKAFENALRLLREIHPGSNESLVEPTRNLVNVLFSLEDRQAARQACGEAMKLYLELYAFYHPYVAECADMLAQLWRKSGDKGRAVECASKAVLSAIKHSDPDLAELAKYRTNYGRVLLENDQPEEAEKEFLEALRICDETNALASKSTGKLFHSLARAISAQNRKEEAAIYYTKALRILQKTEESDTKDLLRLLNDAARLFESLDDLTKAIPCLKQSIVLQSPTMQERRKSYMKDCLRLGRLFVKSDQFDAAEKWLEKVVRLCENDEEFDRRFLADACAALGKLHHEQGDESRSLEQLRRASEISRRRYGEESVEFATSYYHVGCQMIVCDEELAGHGCLNLALRIFEERGEKRNPLARDIRKRLHL